MKTEKDWDGTLGCLREAVPKQGARPKARVLKKKTQKQSRVEGWRRAKTLKQEPSAPKRGKSKGDGKEEYQKNKQHTKSTSIKKFGKSTEK